MTVNVAASGHEASNNSDSISERFRKTRAPKKVFTSVYTDTGLCYRYNSVCIKTVKCVDGKFIKLRKKEAVYTIDQILNL